MIEKLNLLNVDKTFKQTLLTNIVNRIILKQTLSIYFTFYNCLAVKRVPGADILTFICFLESCGKPIINFLEPKERIRTTSFGAVVQDSRQFNLKHNSVSEYFYDKIMTSDHF